MTGALLSAALVAVAGRPWGAGWLAWVAFVPLFASLGSSRRAPTAAARAAVGALGVASVAYEAAAALGAGWHLLALAVGVVPFALAGAAGHAVARRLPRNAAPVTFALFWAAAELLPAQPWLLGPYALPLATFGYSQAELPALHLARFSSVTATSLALLLGNALVLTAVGAWRRAGSSRPPTASVSASASLSLIVAAVTAAWLSAPGAERLAAGGVLDVAVVQPNQPTALLAAAKRVDEAHDEVALRLVHLAAQAADMEGTAPTLLVTPEGAWPRALDRAAPTAALGATGAAALAALPPTLLGAAGSSEGGGVTNSAFLLAGGQLVHAYAKLHLVPVGEAALERGTELPRLTFAGAGGTQHTVAPLICYDVAFPATVRSATRAGAELVAVLTDDAFAVRGDVPHQHLRLARFRAVESGLPVAFASNTGPSGLIDGAGRLIAVTEADESAALRARLGAGVGPTPYVRYGNWVGALTCLAVGSLTALALRGVAGRKGGAPSSRPST